MPLFFVKSQINFYYFRITDLSDLTYFYNYSQLEGICNLLAQKQILSNKYFEEINKVKRKINKKENLIECSNINENEIEKIIENWEGPIQETNFIVFVQYFLKKRKDFYLKIG